MAKYQHPHNNWKSTLAADHHVSDGTLVLAQGDAAALGPLQDYEVYRVCLVSAPESVREVTIGIFEATGVTGNALTGVTAVEGYTDSVISAGTPVRLRATAGTFAAIHADLTSLKAGGGTIVTTGVTGVGAVDIAASIAATLAQQGIPATGDAQTTAFENLINAAGNYANSGTITLNRPVFIDASNVAVSGNGPALSNFAPRGGCSFPLFVPYPRVSADGRTVTAANRPSLTGVLDGSVTGARGFATLGREAGYYQGGAAQNGKVVNGYFTYFQHDLEIRFAIARGSDGHYPTDKPIFGWGDTSGLVPAPLGFAFAASGSFVDIYERRQGDAAGSRFRRVAFDPTLSLNEFIFRWNNTSHAFTARVNHAAGTVTYPNNAGDATYSTPFEAPLRDAPLQFGTSGWNFDVWPAEGAADYTLVGWLIASTLTTSDPVDHHHAYLDGTNAGTIAYFDSTGYEPGCRLLTIKEGPAGRSVETRALILDSHQTGRTGFPSNLSFTGLAMDHSDGAIMFAGDVTVSVKNCWMRYGAMGFGTVRTFVDYVFAFEGCQFGGSHVSYSLYSANANFKNCQLVQGGTTWAMEVGCSTRHEKTIWSGFSADARMDSHFAALNGAEWGKIELIDPIVDNEGFTVTDVFYIESQQNAQRVFMVRGGEVTASCSHVFRLASGGASTTNSFVDIKGFTWGAPGAGSGSVSTVVVDETGWYGTVDPALNLECTITGPGAGNIALGQSAYERKFGATGTPSVNATTPPLYVPWDSYCGLLTIVCGTAPSGGSLTAVVQKSSDGTTWTTLATISVTTGNNAASAMVSGVLPAGTRLRGEFTAVHGAADMIATLALYR